MYSFPEENKARMLALVKNLQRALGERISAVTWMSDETKQKALEKLSAFTIKIGYPDKWRDYTDLRISKADTYYDNLMRAARFEQEYSLSFLDKPVDKQKWYTHYTNCGFEIEKVTDYTQETLPDLKHLQRSANWTMSRPWLWKLQYALMPEQFVTNHILGWLGYDAGKAGIGYYIEWVLRKPK